MAHTMHAPTRTRARGVAVQRARGTLASLIPQSDPHPSLLRAAAIDAFLCTRAALVQMCRRAADSCFPGWRQRA